MKYSKSFEKSFIGKHIHTKFHATETKNTYRTLHFEGYLAPGLSS